MPALLRILALALALAGGGPVLADLAPPAGDVVLTVTGAITETNGAGAATFDLDQLTALADTSLQTTTIWTDGMQEFTGVPLVVLLDLLGARGRTIRASAINDYSIEIPVSDAVADGPIIAIRQNGALMPVREKGPLWVIYPYDREAAYQSEVIYSRSIWQLIRLEILP